jgi:hypothetical protein
MNLAIGRIGKFKTEELLKERLAWHVLPSESTAPHPVQRSDISYLLDVLLKLIVFPSWKTKSLLAIPVP